MSYAGIVTGQNMQRHSDLLSLQYTKHSRLLGESSLSSSDRGSNQIPTVSAGEDKAIPKGTAYYPTATANDPDGDALTYCWEQPDSGRVFRFWTQSTEGSMNRSLVGSNREIFQI